MGILYNFLQYSTFLSNKLESLSFADTSITVLQQNSFLFKPVNNSYKTKTTLKTFIDIRGIYHKKLVRLLKPKK
jgi:hypothetical protein